MQFFKYLVSCKNQTNKQIRNIKENIIEIFSWVRQGLTLLLRISIHNRESRLRNSLKNYLENNL